MYLNDSYIILASFISIYIIMTNSNTREQEIMANSTSNQQQWVLARQRNLRWYSVGLLQHISLLIYFHRCSQCYYCFVLANQDIY